MTFPSTIKRYRLAASLTQAELARHLGVSLQSVSNWETGRRVPWASRQDSILARAASLQPAPVGRPRVSARI